MLKRSKLGKGKSTGLKSTFPLRKTSLKKSKGKSIEQKKQEKEDLERMWNLFNQIWDELPDIKQCSACGGRIYGQNSSIYHDHLMPKHLYPELKYEKRNLFFCCSECHGNRENGFPHPKHLEAINKAKKELL